MKLRWKETPPKVNESTAGRRTLGLDVTFYFPQGFSLPFPSIFPQVSMGSQNCSASRVYIYKCIFACVSRERGYFSNIYLAYFPQSFIPLFLTCCTTLWCNRGTNINRILLNNTIQGKKNMLSEHLNS